MKSPNILFIILVFCVVSSFSQTSAKRPLTPDDTYKLRSVQDARVSPDGAWVAYTVGGVDAENDKRHSDIWMVNWAGTENLQVTRGTESSSTPRWSPDGKYLSYLSARGGEDAKSQIWLLDRRGGEPFAVTDVKGGITGYEWSPDGKRIAVVMENPDEPTPSDKDKDKDKDKKDKKEKVPKPIVITRMHFKQDTEGYLTSNSYGRIYLVDVETKKFEPLTTDKDFDESHPKWSPDGSRIAYISNHAKDPDMSGTYDIFLVDAKPNSQPQKLLTTYQAHEELHWSSDGKALTFYQGFEPKYSAYNQSRLAVVPVAGGEPRVLTAAFDRGTAQAEFSSDGATLSFIAEDDMHEYLAKVPVAGGKVERVGGDLGTIFERNTAGGHAAVIMADDTHVAEIYALEDGKLRKLTSHNDSVMTDVQLGAVEDMSFPSKDGTEVHGLMIKPPDYQAGKKYPTILWIHGGPNGEDDHGFRPDSYFSIRQLLAARGYVVLAVNYRGSSGRGSEFTRAIWADWGNKEVADLLAGVDYAVKKGVADPERLGIGGWSYGGILTDYTIASDTRFKAAISGAGSALQLSMYGDDQYIMQYTYELQPPWKSQDLWIKLSYPFFHADRIKTPTFFLGGQSDFNVPIIGGEQMYQALRTLEVPTQFIVYPGQFHSFTRPSYVRDRMDRFFAWYDKYLK